MGVISAEFDRLNAVIERQKDEIVKLGGGRSEGWIEDFWYDNRAGWSR
jgi:hypothetical protein